MPHSPGFLSLAEAARRDVTEIAIEEYLRNREQGRAAVLIDVREDHEWARGHLPNAIHLGRGIIERDIEKRIPNKETPLILYCGGGFRSLLAASSLKKLGYHNVTSLAGGVRGWKEKGYTLENDLSDHPSEPAKEKTQ